MSAKMRHIAWGCMTCNKIDWVDKSECTAKPEHVPHRGVDVGNCPGKMIKLYGTPGQADETAALPRWPGIPITNDPPADESKATDETDPGSLVHTEVGVGWNRLNRLIRLTRGSDIVIAPERRVAGLVAQGWRVVDEQP